jgi:SNF2 family DNA or RNA helicase
MNNTYIKPTTKLKEFQKQGVKFLLQHKQAVLGDAVGLGKTLQLLTTYSYFKTMYPASKLIFLTNKTVVKQAAQEVDKFFVGLNVLTVYENSKEERQAAFNRFLSKDVDILITNYQALKQDLALPSSITIPLSNCQLSPVFPEDQTSITSTYSSLTLSRGVLQFKLNLTKFLKRYKNVTQADDIIRFNTTDNKSVYIRMVYRKAPDGCLEFTVLSSEGNWQHRHELGKLSRDFTQFFKSSIDNPNRLITVFDEAVALKNPESQIHQFGSWLSSISHKVIAVTATITKGQLEEAYNILKCIGINLTNSYKQFADNFCIFKKSHFKVNGRQITVLTGYKNIQQFCVLVKPHFIGRAKKDVAPELPAFTIKRYVVKETAFTHDAISSIYTDAVYNKVPPNLGRIRIALTTPSLICDRIPKDHFSAKVEELIRLLNEDFIDEKVIVYLDYKSPIDYLAEHLPQHLPDAYKRILKITGDTTDRQSVLNLFNTSSKHNLLFINSAAKEGVNLQAAGHLIFLTLPYRAGDYVQIAGRISRIGTEHQSLVIHNIVQEDSSDTDCESIIQVGLKLMKQIAASSVDEGLEQPELLDSRFQSDDNPEVMLLSSFKSRARRYIKQDLEL